MVKKISIIGSGSVGSTTAFHILANLNVKDLVLVDVAGDLARGIALDLEDTRLWLNFNTRIQGTSNINQIKNSDIVIITCGLARKEGMSRYDLFKTNSNIAKGVALEIKRLAPASIIIVVTNPLDLITYVVTKYSGFGRHRVMGMGSSLDSARLANLIYKRIGGGVACSDINTLVCGSHSKDMLAVMSLTKIRGMDVKKHLPFSAIKNLSDKVRLRGKEIVGFLKNRSAFFAPSLTCYKLVEAVARDKDVIMPVSVLLKGEYGLDGVCLGVPCIINRAGASRILTIELKVSEKKTLKKMRDVFLSCMK